MVFPGGSRCRNDLHAQHLGPLDELAQHALAIAFFEAVLTRVGVLLALGQHRVDQPRELVGGGGNGLALVHAGAQAAVVGS